MNQNDDVRTYVKQLPTLHRRCVRQMRKNITQVTQRLPLCGQVTESLKWGHLSFATEKPKSGTPVRVSMHRDEPDTCVLSVHCQSRLIAQFREMYPQLRYDKNRSLLVSSDALASAPVLHFLEMALMYHRQ